jgi:hypothetical protein
MPLDMDTHEITGMQDDPVPLVSTINRVFPGGTHHSNGLPGTGRSSGDAEANSFMEKAAN